MATAAELQAQIDAIASKASEERAQSSALSNALQNANQAAYAEKQAAIKRSQAEIAAAEAAGQPIPYTSIKDALSKDPAYQAALEAQSTAQQSFDSFATPSVAEESKLKADLAAVQGADSPTVADPIAKPADVANELPKSDAATTVVSSEDPSSTKADGQTATAETSTDQKTVDPKTDPAVTDSAAKDAAATAEDTRTSLKVETSPASATPPKAIIPAQKDWRVRMTLAPNADYLYNDAKGNPNHILYPLYNTKGVIFPYTPTIQTGYRANYEPAELAHTNYKSYFYRNSSVDDISITADFTAQDSIEASYMLAVIHFFKSATKMFYGQDKAPRAGTPPPLVYLSGFGAYQFNNHPMVISSFNYVLPNDVDYIRTASATTYASDPEICKRDTSGGSGGGIMGFLKQTRLGSLLPGGKAKSSSPANTAAFNYLSSSEVTYVPSKIQITITGYPIVSRKDISDRFSVKDYASGKLTKGSTNGNSGIW